MEEIEFKNLDPKFCVHKWFPAPRNPETLRNDDYVCGRCGVLQSRLPEPPKGEEHE
jgi:hypothetical protein